MDKADEILPDGWIRRPSTSKPGRYYYFNTTNGKSQWEKPEKTPTKSKTRAIYSKNATSSDAIKAIHFKISDKSKDIKKTSTKTPAQDRLQNISSKLKKADENVKKVISSAILKSVQLKSDDAASPEKKKAKLTASKAETNSNASKRETIKSLLTSHQKAIVVKTIKPIALKSNQRDQNKASTIVPTPSDDDVTKSLFETFTEGVYTPPKNKTPAQNRLKILQTSLAECEQLSNLSPHLPDGSANANAAFPEASASAKAEEMDWEPCDDISYDFKMLEDDEVIFDESSAPTIIVPDTNIFLQSLICVKDILQKGDNYCVVIPYAVLQELDSLKHRREQQTVSRGAITAMRFIYNQFIEKNPRFKGQKATEDNNHLIEISNADDKILNCCLQLKQRAAHVILASNDINLCNKAIASGVETIDTNKLLAEF